MALFKLLTYGYIRSDERKFQIIIPQEIQLIVAYYIKNYRIFGIGNNEHGSFGIGHIKRLKRWTQLHNLQDLVSSPSDIFVSSHNIMVITLDNKLYVAGKNEHGELGSNILKSIHSFTQVIKNLKFKFISLNNRSHSFLVTTQDTLYVNGDNSFCNTNDAVKHTKMFQQIPTNFLMNNELIIDIQCGHLQTVFLTNLGNIYCHGMNDAGQCGFTEPRKIPIPLLLHMPNNEIISKICVSGLFTLLIDSNNQLLFFGYSRYGEFGLNNNTSRYLPTIHNYFKTNNIKIIDIGSQEATSVFIDEYNNTYSCGFNGLGNVGIGRAKGIVIRAIHKVKFELFDKDNTKIINVSCGGLHTVALSKDNDLICWGSNAHRQCSSLNISKYIDLPHKVSKSKELMIQENAYIEKTYALWDGTIVLVNPLKSLQK